jgi:hypothetical protein
VLAIRNSPQLPLKSTNHGKPDVFETTEAKYVQIVGFPNESFKAVPLPLADPEGSLTPDSILQMGCLLTTELALQIEGVQVVRPVKEITQPRK